MTAPFIRNRNSGIIQESEGAPTAEQFLGGGVQGLTYPFLIMDRTTRTLYAKRANGNVINVSGTDVFTVYNVTSYGAIGDGVTDDGPAIQAALTACPTGGTVFFPVPTAYYRVGAAPATGGQIQLTKSVTLLGGSATVTIKLGPETPSTNNILFRQSSGTDVIVDTLTIEGPDVNNNKLCRGFGWAATPITGTLTLYRVTSTLFQEFVKMEGSATLDSAVLTIEDCDLANSNDGATAYVLIQSGTVVTYGGAWRISRTRMRAGANSYCVYRGFQTSLSLQDCDIGPGDSRGTSLWLIYAEGGATTAPTFDLISNCRFDSTNVTSGAILTNKYATEQIETCSFRGGRSIEFRGSLLCTNCSFPAGGVADLRNDTLADSVIEFVGCSFVNTELTTGTLAATVTVICRGCSFRYTSGANTELAAFNTAGLRLFMMGCQFFGGPTYQIRLDNAAKVVLDGNVHWNSGITAAIEVFAPATVLDLRVTNTWFEDPTVAYQLSVGSNVRRELMPRPGMKEGTIASADLITLDWNYDTFRITGNTTINKIAMQGVSYTSHPTTDTNGKITLIVEGTFDFGAGGNILATAGAQTVGRAVTLVYDGNNGTWIEVRAT